MLLKVVRIVTFISTQYLQYVQQKSQNVSQNQFEQL